MKLASLLAPLRSEELFFSWTRERRYRGFPKRLERLGAAVFSRLPFELADGRRLERDVTTVLLTIDARKAPVPVAFGELRSWEQ